jgi:23S rRNA (pseudouridine1915-N3)-methyltransferase
MRCHVIAVGRAKPGPAQALFDVYANRLNPPLSLCEVDEKRSLPPDRLREQEAALLLSAAPKRAILVGLDESGITLDSAGFAARLGAWRDQSVGDLAFLIGGAAGHGAAVRERVDLVLSLGPMTWPHMLVRGLIAEQLYRGFSILAGHPYHKE